MFDRIMNTDIWSFVGSMPLIIVWIVGIVLCIVRASQQAMACILAGIAIVIAIGSRFILPLIMRFVHSTILHDAGSGTHAFVSSFVYGLATAAAWGLLLWAIFGTANAAKPRQPMWQNDPQRRV